MKDEWEGRIPNERREKDQRNGRLLNGGLDLEGGGRNGRLSNGGDLAQLVPTRHCIPSKLSIQ